MVVDCIFNLIEKCEWGELATLITNSKLHSEHISPAPLFLQLKWPLSSDNKGIAKDWVSEISYKNIKEY